MMSKTHITIGMAASLAIMPPTSIGKLLTTVAGGAVGSVLCDIECRPRKEKRDALSGRLIAVSIVLITLCVGYLTGYGIVTGTAALIQEQSWFRFSLGAFVLLSAGIAGRRSKHRTFTHSLLFLALISSGLYCIAPSLCLPTAIGMLSHLVLDTLNKKPVPWLYPFFRPGFCLRLCHAEGRLNTILMWTGLTATLLLIGFQMHTLLP
ncbi:MAG: metal-dependent hydrolase [Clostridia bacterium]|nr:metal-dependent hydrolase [Clostridia bacterium]